MKTLFLLLVLLAACGSKDSSSSNTILQGTWKTDCLATTSGIYEIDNIAIDGQTFIDNLTFYQDSACLDPLITVTRKSTFSLTGTNGIDYSFSSLTAVITNANAIANSNGEQLFGYNNWVVNSPQNVSGRTLFGQAGGETTGTLYLNVYEISSNELVLGDPSTTERPTSVDSSVVYHQ